MNTEFDPTLTTQGQSSYAGSMPGPDSPGGAEGAPRPPKQAFDTGGQAPLSQDQLRQAAEQFDEMGLRLSPANEETGKEPQQTNEQYIEDLESQQQKASPEKELELQKEIELRKEKLAREKNGNQEKKRERRELDDDIQDLKNYDLAKVKKWQDELDKLNAIQKDVSDEVVAKRKELGTQISKENIKVQAAADNIRMIAWKAKRVLTGEDRKIINPQFEASWQQMDILLKKLDKTRDTMRAREYALELADLVKPFYQAEKPRIDENNIYWVPKNAEDLWMHVANSQSEEFAVGGKYALIAIKDNPDAPNGKEITLNKENIFEWLRREITRVHEFNSTAQSELLGNLISLRAGFTQFGIAELLVTPKYWLHETKTADGKPTEITYQPYMDLQDQLFMEIWKYSFIHDKAVEYRNAMGSEEKLAEVLGEFYNRKNVMTATRGRLRDSFCYGSTDVDTHSKNDMGEISYKLGRKPDSEAFQGTLGKATRRLQVAYGYLGESVMVPDSQQHWRLQEDGELQDNLFEKALGTEGSREFYRTIIREIFTKEYQGTFEVAEDILDSLNAGRKDWEKADLLDLLFNGEEKFIAQLVQEKVIESKDDYDEIIKTIQKKWTDEGRGDEFNKQRPILAKGKLEILKEVARKKKYGIKLDDKGNFTGEFAQYIQHFAAGGNMRGFAVELARHVWVKDDNNILNIFSDPNKGQVTQRVRDAMVQAMVKECSLRTSEVKYGEGFVFDLAFLMGSAAANDVEGIGHNAWTKWMIPGKYREGQTDFKNPYGNPVSISDIKKLSGTFAQFTKVRKDGENEFTLSLQYYLQGGEGKKMDLDSELAVFDFREQASAQFQANHIVNVAKVFKNLNTIEVAFSKLITYDPRTGASFKNFEEFQQFIENYWKTLRYAEKNSDPPVDEEFRSWTYKGDLGLGYAVKRPATVTTKKLKELMVSKEVLSLGMPDLANNIFVYLIGAQIALHLPPLCNRFGFKKYGIEEIQELHDLFAKASRSSLFEGQDITLILPAISEDQWKRMMKKIARTRWWKLYANTYGWDAGGMVKDIFTDIFGSFIKAISPFAK